MTRPYDLVVCDPGAVFLDVIFEGLPGLPELGREIFARKLTVAPGGSYNTAVALARLGLSVALVALTGSDPVSDFLLESLKAEGVDTRHMMRVRGDAKAVTVSLSFPKDRAFVSYVDREGLHEFPMALLDRKRTRAVLLTTLAPHRELAALARAARNGGVRVATDFHNFQGSLSHKGTLRRLKSADLLLPNALEAKAVTERKNVRQALKALAEFAETAVKDGSRGALGCRNGEIVRVAGRKTRVADTTGAGDCFNAGYLSGWLENLPLEECLARGNACGGLSVQKAGGTAGAPSPAEFHRELQRYGFGFKRS